MIYPAWWLLQYNESLWEVETGRRDGTVSLESEALAELPSPFANFANLKQAFAGKGLSSKDLVVLSGNQILLGCYPLVNFYLLIEWHMIIEGGGPKMCHGNNTLLNSGQVHIALELETANFSATGYTISTGQTAPIPL